MNYIQHIIVDEFEYYKFKYKLKGIILLPSDDHYTSTLINLQNNSFLMENLLYHLYYIT